MRGDVVYRIYGVHAGREEDTFFGAFRSVAEAEAEIAKLHKQKMDGRNWAEQHHNRGFVIREVIVETDFEIPPLPKPRDKYAVNGRKVSRRGAWDATHVEVFRRTGAGGSPEKVCEYDRNYRLLQTFEPFRQGSRELALISREYTRTAVLDLASGQVIAEEPEESGFCPAGFYVPDWWDVNDGFTIPGSKHWKADREWPTGDFGFVWGCHWGEDDSWKVQYLDLSDVQRGVVRREERFGHLELATSGFNNPCLTLDPPPRRKSDPPPFIRVSRWDGTPRITFAVEMAFDLGSGKPVDWERQKIEDYE